MGQPVQFHRPNMRSVVLLISILLAFCGVSTVLAQGVLKTKDVFTLFSGGLTQLDIVGSDTMRFAYGNQADNKFYQISVQLLEVSELDSSGTFDSTNFIRQADFTSSKVYCSPDCTTAAPGIDRNLTFVAPLKDSNGPITPSKFVTFGIDAEQLKAPHTYTIGSGVNATNYTVGTDYTKLTFFGHFPPPVNSVKQLRITLRGRWNIPTTSVTFSALKDLWDADIAVPDPGNFDTSKIIQIDKDSDGNVRSVRVDAIFKFVINFPSKYTSKGESYTIRAKQITDPSTIPTFCDVILLFDKLPASYDGTLEYDPDIIVSAGQFTSGFKFRTLVIIVGVLFFLLVAGLLTLIICCFLKRRKSKLVTHSESGTDIALVSTNSAPPPPSSSVHNTGSNPAYLHTGDPLHTSSSASYLHTSAPYDRT